MNRKIIAVGALLLVQLLAIGFLIVRYERVVSQGTEVRFKCQAYDPCDPWRGRYLRTTVQERTENIPSCVTNDFHAFQNKFVVRIEASTNGLWRVAEAALEPSGEGLWIKPPSSRVDRSVRWGERRNDESPEDFEKRRKKSGYSVYASFPNQLFVNEKLAPEAEKLLRKQGVEPVAVYRVLNGEIVITDIEIDGKSIVNFAKEISKQEKESK